MISQIPTQINKVTKQFSGKIGGKEPFYLKFEIKPYNTKINMTESHIRTVRGRPDSQHFVNWLFVDAKELKNVRVSKITDEIGDFYVSSTKWFIPAWLRDEEEPIPSPTRHWGGSEPCILPCDISFFHWTSEHELFRAKQPARLSNSSLSSTDSMPPPETFKKVMNSTPRNRSVRTWNKANECWELSSVKTPSFLRKVDQIRLDGTMDTVSVDENLQDPFRTHNSDEFSHDNSRSISAKSSYATKSLSMSDYLAAKQYFDSVQAYHQERLKREESVQNHLANAIASTVADKKNLLSKGEKKYVRHAQVQFKYSARSAQITKEAANARDQYNRAAQAFASRPELERPVVGEDVGKAVNRIIRHNFRLPGAEKKQFQQFECAQDMETEYNEIFTDMIDEKCDENEI